MSIVLYMISVPDEVVRQAAAAPFHINHKFMKDEEPTMDTKEETELFGLERGMFLSLPVAIFLVPLWVVCGRNLMGGPGGWGTLMLAFFAGPVLIVAHVVLFVVAKRRNMQAGVMPGEFRVSPVIARVLCVYYAALFFMQVFLNDGGGVIMGSVANRYFGLNKDTSDVIAAIFTIVSIIALVILLGLVFTLKFPQRGGNEEDAIALAEYINSV